MLLRTKAYVRLLRVFIHSCLCFMCCCLQVNIFLIELLHSEKLAQKGGKKKNAFVKRRAFLCVCLCIKSVGNYMHENSSSSMCARDV